MKREKPHVYMEIPIYLCGSQPALPPLTSLPSRAQSILDMKTACSGRKERGRGKGGGNVISVESSAPDSPQKILWLF